MHLSWEPATLATPGPTTLDDTGRIHHGTPTLTVVEAAFTHHEAAEHDHGATASPIVWVRAQEVTTADTLTRTSSGAVYGVTTARKINQPALPMVHGTWRCSTTTDGG